MQALAQEMNLLRDRLRAAAVERRCRRPHPDLHAGARAAVRGPSDARVGVRPRRAALEDRDPARDGRGHRPRRARAGRPADRLRVDGAADPGLAARRRTRRRSSPRWAPPSRSCRSSATTSARAMSTSRSARRKRSLRSRRTALRSSARPGTVSTASPGTARAGRRVCSRRTTASSRTRPRARLPGRSPFISHVTGGSRSGSGSRSRRARRSGGPRRSSRPPTASGDVIERVTVGGSAVVVARGEFGF